jgi:dihydroxyacetone kinase-like predicted kinase
VVTAVVAVAAGAGLARICAGLGAQQVVAGGQSMNPSTAQILEAVEAAPAQEVVVLPNNANVVAVAEQAGSLTAKTVRVVRTTSAPEGLAALLAYDPGAGADDNAVAMEAAASAVTVGEVTTAVRSASSPAGPVTAGDHLGLSRDGIEVVSSVLEEAATGLLARLVGDEHEIVTVIEGDGSTAEATRRITEWLAEHRPGAAVEVHHGGQPLYPYLFSIE